MDLNLNLLKYYYIVVNEKNITKAAEKAFITQPAMTRAIKELENQLNTKLLDRSQKGVYPTKDGLILYKHIENILKEVDLSQQIIENNKKTDLYIGTTTSNFFDIITKSLNIFKEKYPNIRVHITFDTIDILEEMNKVDKLDIVIKNKNETISSYKKVDELLLNNIFVASSKHYPELKNKRITLKKLIKDYPLVIMSNNSPGRKNFDNYLKENKINYKPTYEFNSYDLCKKLVLGGIGIGIGNENDFSTDEYIILDTDKLPTRFFDIGYIETSNNPFIKKFLQIYNSEK